MAEQQQDPLEHLRQIIDSVTTHINLSFAWIANGVPIEDKNNEAMGDMLNFIDGALRANIWWLGSWSSEAELTDEGRNEVTAAIETLTARLDELRQSVLALM